MFRRILSNHIVKQTRNVVSFAVKTAFSNKYLLVTNAVVSAGLSGAADSVVQKSCRHAGVGKYNNHKTGSIDGTRVCKMAFIGLVSGVIGHYWYIFIDKKFIGNTMPTVLKKTLFDQLFWAPIGMCVFFVVLGLLDGFTIKEIKSEVKQKGAELVLVDWLVYPPAQIINFRFLPTRYRVIYDCFIAFVLDIYYSHLKYER